MGRMMPGDAKRSLERGDGMRYNGRSISVEGGHARFMRLKKTAEGVEVFSMMPWEEEHLVVLAAQGRV